MKKINVILCYGLMLAVSGCASPKKAELVSGNPDNAVAEVTKLLNHAESAQLDLLADEQYIGGRKYVAKAEKSLSEGDKGERVLEDAAIAKAYFQDAKKLGGSRSSIAERVLKARNSALQAGLRESEVLVEEMEDVDDDVKDATQQFSLVLDPANFSKFQKKYLALEVKAVQFRELNAIKLSQQKSIDNDAEDRAPNTLRIAMLDLKEAENIIEQSPRNPEIYKKGVQKSIDSTVLLADTMDVILNAKGTPENIALKIVQQNRELGKLSKNLGELEANLKTTKSNLKSKQTMLDESKSALMAQEGVLMEQKSALKAQGTALIAQENALMEKDSVLKLQNEQLQRASTQVRFQKAMDEAREQLSESDALAYQQGSNLIFRLKSINFRSGTANIPDASMPLLSKVNAIIKKLDAELVVVQGHTDAVGSDDFNQQLSAKRATSVASYLSSLDGGYSVEHIGYGEAKPIASNEAESGRAMNRRVDLVVTAKK